MWRTHCSLWSSLSLCGSPIVWENSTILVNAFNSHLKIYYHPSKKPLLLLASDFCVAKYSPKSDDLILSQHSFLSLIAKQRLLSLYALLFFLHCYVKSSGAAVLDTTAAHPELLAEERKNRTVDNRWIWNNRCRPSLSAPVNWRRSRKTTCLRVKCVWVGGGGGEWAGCVSTQRGQKLG